MSDQLPPRTPTPEPEPASHAGDKRKKYIDSSDSSTTSTAPQRKVKKPEYSASQNQPEAANAPDSSEASISKPSLPPIPPRIRLQSATPSAKSDSPPPAEAELERDRHQSLKAQHVEASYGEGIPQSSARVLSKVENTEVVPSGTAEYEDLDGRLKEEQPLRWSGGTIAGTSTPSRKGRLCRHTSKDLVVRTWDKKKRKYNESPPQKFCVCEKNTIEEGYLPCTAFTGDIDPNDIKRVEHLRKYYPQCDLCNQTLIWGALPPTKEHSDKPRGSGSLLAMQSTGTPQDSDAKNLSLDQKLIGRMCTGVGSSGCYTVLCTMCALEAKNEDAASGLIVGYAGKTSSKAGDDNLAMYRTIHPFGPEMYDSSEVAITRFKSPIRDTPTPPLPTPSPMESGVGSLASSSEEEDEDGKEE